MPFTPGERFDPSTVVLREIAEMWAYARESGIAQELKALHHPRLSRTLSAVAGDWGLIVLATVATVLYGWLAVPLSLFLIGNRQRALGNILHDASHRSFGGNRPHVTMLENLLFCWPLWVSMMVYRGDHNAHHKYLADPMRDPDYIHDPGRLSRGWFSVWMDQILSPRMFRTSLLSHLTRMDGATLLAVLCWWAVLLGLVALVFNVNVALIFLGLWVAARATSFHVITSFREISDHVGLIPDGLISFSRNHPFSSLVGQIFHPHNNGYHLLHHLMPGLPYHAMPRAHALLMNWRPYAEAEQCEGYFIGEKCAVRSWVRRWEPGPAAG